MLVPLNCFILMSSLYTQKVYLRKFNSHFNTRRRSKRDFCRAIENITNKSNNSSLSKSVCDKKGRKSFYVVIEWPPMIYLGPFDKGPYYMNPFNLGPFNMGASLCEAFCTYAHICHTAKRHQNQKANGKRPQFQSPYIIKPHVKKPLISKFFFLNAYVHLKQLGAPSKLLLS